MSTTRTCIVTGMTCGHCEGSVRSEVSQLSDATNVEVSVTTRRLTAASEGQADDAAVIATVAEAG